MLVESAYSDYTDFRIPGMVATEKGSLLRYCECRRSRSDWADIDIKVSRSTDVGECWQTVLVIESNGNTLNNPVMFVCGERLIFLYCKNYKEIYKCVSLDDGKSFSEPVRVEFEKNVNFFYNVVALGPGHGIYHNGRLAVPMWFAYNSENPKAHAPSFAATFYSDDCGESWLVGEPIFPNEIRNGSEGALAIGADGDYLISLRNEGEKRARAIARSSDGISGWHSLRFEEKLADPICMGSMTHKDGKIYHINCDNGFEVSPGPFSILRINLSVKISDDGFETIRTIPVSYYGGYSDIAVLRGKICVLYEKTIKSADGKTCAPFELFFEALDE